MQKRHFLVQKDCDGYKLREIDAAIGRSINRFGTVTGQCHTVESIRWIFYFMNAHLSEDQADAVASDLTQEFLERRR